MKNTCIIEIDFNDKEKAKEQIKTIESSITEMLKASSRQKEKLTKAESLLEDFILHGNHAMWCDIQIGINYKCDCKGTEHSCIERAKKYFEEKDEE